MTQQNESGPTNGAAPGRTARATERTDAPMYLARYRDRRKTDQDGAPVQQPADQTPLYLRRFRSRPARDEDLGATVVWEGEQLGHTRGWAEVTRTKELPGAGHPLAAQVSTVAHLIRHGETQGYSTESGLTPLGSWQAHRRGFDLSKAVQPGEQVRLICADTNRARQTAEHLQRGLLDGLAQWRKDADVGPVTAMPEFQNFQVATPTGLRDVTAAFREYLELMERYERTATGDRPGWMIEVDRFWRTQAGGGDPIHHWLSIPMLYFEPATSTVRRFWSGIRRAAAEHPGARLLIATHSGPIRAFATWAVGYDPGEPYNTEEVLVRLFDSGRQASVGYRNRVQEVLVPQVELLPDWYADAAARSSRAAIEQARLAAAEPTIGGRG